MQKQIIVIGANGQVGKEIKNIEHKFFKYLFADYFSKEDLDISNIQQLTKIFESKKYDYCINCSAYTKVDKAEEEKELNYLINASAVKNLATICKTNNVGLIHFSTDYVFYGTNNTPYKENEQTNPINEYGKAKLEGEKFCLQENNKSIVFRTSWVYSSEGNNFVKTMMKLMKEKTELSIVADQIGTPTYARDIAFMTLKIIKNKNIEKNWGQIFNFTNKGITSWYLFAEEIKKLNKFNTILKPIKSEEFKTLAQRPKYSVLDKTKFKTKFNIPLIRWKKSLKQCIALLK